MTHRAVNIALCFLLAAGVASAQSTGASGSPSSSSSGNAPPITPISGVTRAGNTPPCQNLGVEQNELEKGYTYQEGGLDWDNSTWSCVGGSLQSPINFPSPSAFAYGSVTASRAASFAMGQATTVQVRTTASYRIQLEAYWQGTNISIPVCGGNVGCLNNNMSTPAYYYQASIQLITFHIPSDHSIFGVQYPMEAQIMASISSGDLSSCPPNGCQVGISVLYELFDDPTAINTFLDSLIPYIPYNGAGCHGFPSNVSLDLNDFMPGNLSYFTYRGSFTAPPCSEGLTWFVFNNPQQVGVDQVVAVQNAMAQVQRPCGDGRVQKKKKKPASSSSSGSGSGGSGSSGSGDNSSAVDNSGRRRHQRLLKAESGASACLVSGTRSNNRPAQLLGSRIINFYQNPGNSSASE